MSKASSPTPIGRSLAMVSSYSVTLCMELMVKCMRYSGLLICNHEYGQGKFQIEIKEDEIENEVKSCSLCFPAKLGTTNPT
jgi:hypothetical protein